MSRLSVYRCCLTGRLDYLSVIHLDVQNGLCERVDSPCSTSLATCVDVYALL